MVNYQLFPIQTLPQSDSVRLKVIGIGCAKSRGLKRNVDRAIQQISFPIIVDEVTELDEIMKYNISATPALILNDKVVAQRTVPSVEEIVGFIQHQPKENMKQLRTILVPTDFSESAKGAFLFASQLAQQFDAQVKVVHCYTGVYDPNQVFILDNLQEYQEAIQQRLKHFIRPSPESLPEDWRDVQTEIEPVLGFPVEEIVSLSASPHTDLIVMGTTGEHDALEHLFGSVSSAVSQKAHCPVLLIPKGVSYKSFHQILYASDFSSTDDESIQKMLDFTAQFNATLHFVHISNQAPTDFDITERLLSKLGKSASSSRYRIVSINDSSTIEGLNGYAQKNHIDLAVLVTKHRSFWESLLHRSTTKRMALTTQLPLMVLHQGE